MKLYIAKCNKVGEEVPFTGWAKDGPFHYKEYIVWIDVKPFKQEDGTFSLSNGVSHSEDELYERFFYNRKDWLDWSSTELKKIKEDPTYISELNLFIVL